MRIIAVSTLRDFYGENSAHLDAKQPVLAWHSHVQSVIWEAPADVKRDFRNASILKGSRVVFNIAGNQYRLVVMINYPKNIVFIRFIGTHARYDQIDAQTG